MVGRLGRGRRPLDCHLFPRATESEFVYVPMTLSVLRPTVLFPITWRDWDDAKLDAVIAHEMSHVDGGIFYPSTCGLTLRDLLVQPIGLVAESAACRPRRASQR